MVTIGMNYLAIPNKEKAFESKFAKVVGALEAAPGHDKSVLYRDVSNKQAYMIVSQWNDEEAYNAFISSPEFRAVTDWGKEHILAARPSHEVYGSKGAS